MLRLFSRARPGGAARGSASIYAGWKDCAEGETRGARASSESALTLGAKCRVSESFKGGGEFAESCEGLFGLLSPSSTSPATPHFHDGRDHLLAGGGLLSEQSLMALRATWVHEN